MLDKVEYIAAPEDATSEKDNTAFRVSVIAGLSAKQKTLECKYLYDDLGSDLFDQICDLPEYYPTRTELGILEAATPEIARIVGNNAELVELGSGASRKTRLLLSAFDTPALYVPVDISADYMMDVAAKLRGEYPALNVEPVVADFIAPFELPVKSERGSRLLFFPGSTIGNLHRSEAAEFLRSLARTSDADYFVIGVDLKKDPAILEAAYDDAAGVTAAFNLNLLRRINRELGANFDLVQFEHKAIYNEGEGRVEMHMVSRTAQNVFVGDSEFEFGKGETIHSENSYKYGLDEFADMAKAAGWQSEQFWTDPDTLFAVFLLAAPRP